MPKLYTVIHTKKMQAVHNKHMLREKYTEQLTNTSV